MSNTNVYVSIFCFCSILLIFYAMSRDNDVSMSESKLFETFKLIQPIKGDTKFRSNKSFSEILIENGNLHKYIGCNFYETGGIGYQLWRFASLYGIGREVNRLPYFDGQNLEQMINLKEIGQIFPTMLEILQVKNPSDSIVETISFAEELYEFENPKRLSISKAKYLKVKGNYLQSYRYFDKYTNEIRQILKCSATIEFSNKDFAENLFKYDATSFKVCAHIRRDDFINSTMLESKKDFIYAALDYASVYLNSEKIKNISLIFIGDDYLFAKNLIINNIFHKIHILETRSRGEDMCFGIKYCDAMIMTASGSAFAWWISYLLKSNGPVFYNSQIGRNGKTLKDVYDFDIFPKEWIKLTVTNGKAVKEEKWWREKIHT